MLARIQTAVTSNSVLLCSPGTFAVIWLVVLVTHLVVGLSLLFVALSTLILLLPEFQFAVAVLMMLDVRLDPIVSQCVVVVATSIGLLHWWMALQAIRRSTAASELTFSASQRGKPAFCWRVPQVLLLPLRALGLRGRYFDAGFALRKTTEVAVQTIQCFRNSRDVARVWLNRVCVSLLVLNCLSTLCLRLLGRWRRYDVVTVRVWCLGLDIILNVTMSLVLTCLILFPYVQSAQTVDAPDPAASNENPVWMVQAKSELHLVLQTSWLDLVLQFLPPLTMLLALQDLKLLLRKKPTSRSKTNQISVLPRLKKLQPSSDASSSSSQSHYRPAYVLDAVFGCLSVAILTLHCRGFVVDKLHAEANAAPCELQLHPWWSSQITCGVVRFDCHRLRLNGSASEIEKLMAPFDLLRVGALTFVHCSTLEMPPIITRLPNLMMIEVFNCTIVSWGEEAALSAANHSSIFQIYLYRVNLDAVGNTLPPGLLSDAVPPSLVDLMIGETNLSALSSDFPRKWRHPMVALALDHCELSSLPVEMANMSFSIFISVDRNEQLREIPPSLYGRSYYVSVNGNRELALPLNMSVLSSTIITQDLSIQNTSITTLPKWVIDAQIPRVWASSSPLCDAHSSRQVQHTTINCEVNDRMMHQADFEAWVSMRRFEIPS